MATKASEIRRLHIEPSTGTLGAEISGVDLSQPLDDEIIAEIRQALLDNLVIFFRDQHITPEQQIAFGRRFGELHTLTYRTARAIRKSFSWKARPMVRAIWPTSQIRGTRT